MGGMGGMGGNGGGEGSSLPPSRSAPLRRSPSARVGASLPGARPGTAVGDVVWAKLGTFPWWPARVRRVLRAQGKLRLRFFAWDAKSDRAELRPAQLMPYEEGAPIALDQLGKKRLSAKAHDCYATVTRLLRQGAPLDQGKRP